MRLILLVLVTITPSCARRSLGSFGILPAQPDYLVRSPDAKETPFPEVVSRYSNAVPGQGWLDLRPHMDLRIENAYYRNGLPKRGITGYLGTEVAFYQVRPKGGVRLGSAESKLTESRPAGQQPVQELIRASQRNFRYYRFFYAVVFKKKADTRGSVLLAAKSTKELSRLATQLTDDPDTVCGGQSKNCTVFPEACTVSIEIEIVVNGKPRTVLLGSFLSTVAAHPKHVEMLRLHAGRPTPVEIDPSDPNALRLPLLPGDKITWE